MPALNNKKGFTLIELMLVLVVIAVMLVFAFRMIRIKTEHMLVDRTSLQMQQIFEAATSYYIDQFQQVSSTPNQPLGEGGSWPSSIQDLVNDTYLPTNFVNVNPWGNPYSASPSPANTNVTPAIPLGRTYIVTTTVPNSTIAMQIANSLPIASYTTVSPFTVTAQINIPSYNYNNARAVNQVYYYQPGQCLTLPSCPDGMTGAAALSVSRMLGYTEQSSGVLPITSFQTYLGAVTGTVSSCNLTDLDHSSGSTWPVCTVANNQYQVCIAISTSDDQTVALTNTQANQISIMATLQCIPGAANNSGNVPNPPL